MALSRNMVRESEHWSAIAIRELYYFPRKVSVPIPKMVSIPLRVIYEILRDLSYFLRRVFIAEPILKSYCHKYGRGVHTDIFVPWVQGKGEISLGNYVLIDGKCGFTFTSRYTDPPRLVIGDYTGIGHGCSITVAKEVVIGKHCRIASGVLIFDAPGHPADSQARLRGEPAADGEVRPIHIGDNVWIGRNAIIFPGVCIGDNSIVAAGSVVSMDVPPNNFVAGNPARRIRQTEVNDAKLKESSPM